MKTLYTALMDLILVLVMLFGLGLFATGIYSVGWHLRDTVTCTLMIVSGLILVFGAWGIQRKFVHPKQALNQENKDGK